MRPKILAALYLAVVAVVGGAYAYSLGTPTPRPADATAAEVKPTHSGRAPVPPEPKATGCCANGDCACP